MDMKVQENLWEKVLVASSWTLIFFGYSSDESSDNDELTNIRKHSFMPLPDHVTPFWRLWRVDVWGQ